MVEDLAFDFASHNVRAARNKTQALKESNIPPILLDDASRAAMTVSRRDCDLIPRWGSHFLRRQARRILHNGLRIVAIGYYGDEMTGIKAQRKRSKPGWNDIELTWSR
jgi:hypothetical protein